MRYLQTSFWLLSLTAGMALSHAQEVPPLQITVCVSPENYWTLVPAAKSVATQLFAGVGIGVVWRGPSHCPRGAIQMKLSNEIPRDLPVTALADAKAYEGTNIRVFPERLPAMRESSRSILLGHVMAHEICHMLQSVNLHSDTGLMKARWTMDDYQKMRVTPLRFSDRDIELMHVGLVRRQALLASAF